MPILHTKAPQPRHRAALAIEGMFGVALALAGVRLLLLFADPDDTASLLLLALGPVLLRVGFDRMLDAWARPDVAGTGLARITVLFTAAITTVVLGHWTGSPWALFAAIPLLLLAGRMALAEIYGGRLY